MAELALVDIAQQDRVGAQPGRDAATIAEACSDERLNHLGSWDIRKIRFLTRS